MCLPFAVKLYLPAQGVCIVRCSRDSANEVQASMTFIVAVNDLDVAFSLVSSSGALRLRQHDVQCKSSHMGSHARPMQAQAGCVEKK